MAGYEIFPGNLNDSKAVRGIVGTMETRHGKVDQFYHIGKC